jgi:uncharacterized protein YecT (DUF1311 family)
MFARIGGRKIAMTLALAIPFACPRLTEGADEATLRREIQSADLELNADYQAVLRTLSKGGTERLRIAERAWLTFIVKNEEAVAEAAPARRFASALVLQSRLIEIRQRCEELRAMLGQQPASLAAVSLSGAQADADLNKVYQECVRTRSPGIERHLREAQRAWVDFRDKHVAANSGGTTAPPAFSLLTIHRAISLRTIYLNAPTGPDLSRPTDVAGDKKHDAGDPSIPDPFATAR